MPYKDKKKEIKHITERRRNYKKKLVKLKGGKCQICGYSKCMAALEFHHLSKQKEAKISYIYNRGWKRILQEIKNTILVCSNCHKEIHSKNIFNQSKLLTLSRNQ